MARITVFLCALVLALAASDSHAQGCDPNDNSGGGDGWRLYNFACTNPALPYCTGGNKCNRCYAGKDSACDCPINWQCVSGRFNPYERADFCAPLPEDMYGQACQDDNDCAWQLPDYTQNRALGTAHYLSCVNNQCVFCNGRAVSFGGQCTQGRASNIGQHLTHGSVAPSTTTIDGYRVCFPDVNAWVAHSWPLDLDSRLEPLPENPYAGLTPPDGQATVNPTPTTTTAALTTTRAGSSPTTTTAAGTNKSTRIPRIGDTVEPGTDTDANGAQTAVPVLAVTLLAAYVLVYVAQL